MDWGLVDKAAMTLPAAGIAEEVNERLAHDASLVITAPPGAGKSTLLPLTIMKGLPGKGKVLMLEPRRLAARQIAERMASMLGETVGNTVGYRIRFEAKVSDRTRIEVLTEGILTRMLISDPTLEGVDAVIFDEFHERSLASDEALALTRQSQILLRDDLRVIVMSATIDASAICKSLGASHVSSEGRMFPIEIVYANETSALSCSEDVAHMVRVAHRDTKGDILAFLPGEGEIRRCQELLGDALGTTAVLPLYGYLSSDEQRKAIAPSPPGERKVVLATPIAETSITIEGVRTVIDSGLCRRSVFDARNGLSHLETVRISMDMATQRSGRAGRVAPGTCYRLWGQGTEARMTDSRTPEIEEADLTPLMLDMAAWGETDIYSLPWITPPPAFKVAQGQKLLQQLGAIDRNLKITSIGQKMAGLPCHPRISRMLCNARTAELKALACDIAALMEEKDPMPDEGADITARIEALRSHRGGRAWSRIARIAEQYRSMVHVREDCSMPDSHKTGALIAAAYPERIGKALREGGFTLASGDMACVDRNDLLAGHEWIAVASLNAKASGGAKIFLGAALDIDDVRDMMIERDNVSWDSRKGVVVAQRELRIGGLTVSARPIHSEVREEIVQTICEAARKEGTSMLDFSDEVQNLQRRVAAVAQWHPELELPDLGTESVLGSAPEWLPLYMGKATSAAELKKIDLKQALWGLLSYGQQTAVERLAPSHIEVPTGSKIRVEYRIGAEAPVLRVRLQECFGLLDTPTVDGGTKAVLMELLSPGFKPVQLTSDLRSFWEGTYFEVRKELRRRYPKHSWPDNPLEAEAVRGVRRKV